MKRGLQAVQQRCQPSDWRNGLIFFFGCFGSGGSGGGSKPWQRAAIAQSRNLPTNPCLWLGLWRCMSLLDISCQLALGTLDSILLVHSLSSDCLGWCRRCKPLQCLFMGGTQSLILKVKINCSKNKSPGPPKFRSDVLRWSSKCFHEPSLQSILGKWWCSFLFIPAFCRIARHPPCCTNRYTPELTGNISYFCHSSNWKRTTLIDRAGCNAIKT